MNLNASDYKVVHEVTPEVDLQDLIENQMGDHHAVVFAPGTYTYTDGYINCPWHNTHLFAEESSYMDGPLDPKPFSLVRIRAGIRFHGAQEMRATGIDFLTAPNVANFYTFQGTYFLTDCYGIHRSGDAAPWLGGGGFISSYGGGFSIECAKRDFLLNHALETSSGIPIKMKDGGYLRITASANGWKPRIIFAKDIGIQIAGVGGFAHDIDITGPGKFTKTTGLEVARGGGDFFLLKTLGSPEINQCGTGILVQSGGKNCIRATPSAPLFIRNCSRGIVSTEGGRMHLVADRSVKYFNVDVRVTQDRDEVIYQ